MKKYFTSFVAAGTVASFAAACHKKAKPKAATADKKDTKKTEAKKATSSTLKKGTIQKGQFKVGVVGSEYVATQRLKHAVNAYTQDVKDTNKVGDSYFKLPSGLELKSSSNFNSTYGDKVETSSSLHAEVVKLKAALKTLVPLATSSSSTHKFGEANSVRKHGDSDGLKASINATNGSKIANAFLMVYTPTGTRPTDAQYNDIFTDAKLKKLYQNLPSDNPTGRELLDALKKSGFDVDDRFRFWTGLSTNSKGVAGTHWFVPTSDGAKTTGRLYFNKTKLDQQLNDLGANALGLESFDETSKTFKDESKKALSDKTQLASKNLDALFVQVTDGAENDEKVYKAVVEKKEFKNTHLFFVGDKAKSQTGSSSKTFAGGKVSTASYDKYAAAYVAGFQAAAGALKYSDSEDSFVETNVVFLIGAITDSDAKRKAFAFRRGVEAAKKHSAYSKYLKVKFVSKTEDTSKSSKKLVRDVSDWKEKSDSKTKLHEFTSSDTFSDAERRVIYIAGTTAKDWVGEVKRGDLDAGKALTGDLKDHFWKGDDAGLIGALYNVNKDDLEKKDENGESFDTLSSSKTYSRNVWVVLDKAYGATWEKESDWVGKQDEDGAKTSPFANAFTKGSLSDGDNLWQVYAEITKDNAGKITNNHQVGLTFERRDVRFYGSIGQESEGTKVYTRHALKALFMGGVNYMVGKHTIFGAPLDVSLTKYAGTAGLAATQEKDETTKKMKDNSWNISKEDKNQPWLKPRSTSSAGKNKGRYQDSLSNAWERELTKDALVKESAWLK